MSRVSNLGWTVSVAAYPAAAQIICHNKYPSDYECAPCDPPRYPLQLGQFLGPECIGAGHRGGKHKCTESIRPSSTKDPALVDLTRDTVQQALSHVTHHSPGLSTTLCNR